MLTTEGTLLAGRLRYRQPASGYRTGIEPVLLAACVPARPGQRVLEGGAGAGAGLMCLAARVPDVRGAAVELDADMAELARANFAANGFGALVAVEGDVTQIELGAADHAMANPPWFSEAGTPSPLPGRQRAKHGAPELVAAWVRALAAGLRRRGTLTLALPAASVPDGLAALAAAGCGSPALLPLWPRAGRPAKIVLLQAIRGGSGAFRLAPGVVLHEVDGRYTAAADAVLRGGAALAL